MFLSWTTKFGKSVLHGAEIVLRVDLFFVLRYFLTYFVLF